MLRVHLLGDFRAEIGDALVPSSAWRSSRASGLVKLLALSDRHLAHRETCFASFWPDLPPKAAANNLNVALARARRALSMAGASPGHFLYRNGETIVLARPEELWIDVDAFRKGVDIALGSERKEDAHAAAELYRGDLLLEDPYEDWIQPIRDSLRTEYVALLLTIAQLEAEEGRIDAAVVTCRRIRDRDPSDESAVAMLMQYLEQSGSRARALAEFNQLSVYLRETLDLEPGTAVSTLANRIRSGHGTEDRASPQALRGYALPQPLDDLIGRRQERVEIGRLLSANRLVTLCGPGGIGKTRLAIAVAHDMAPAFADRVVFIDLSAQTRAERALAMIADSMSISIGPASDPVDEIVHYARDSKLLIVLDNTEQLPDLNPFLQELLNRTSRLTLLVTSRSKLRLTAEQAYPVPALGLPKHSHDLEAASVELFVRQAQAVNPLIQITENEHVYVVELCLRLEGLPLALELAAARINLLSPKSMLSRLDTPLELLASGPSDLPERQQTMRNTIGWSHALLSRAEQDVLHRLAVFSGGWTLEAAEAVLGRSVDGISVLGLLNSLADKHLIEIRKDLHGIRFSQLISIRSFSVEYFEDCSDAPEIRRRHAAWYLAFAETASGYWETDDQAEWLERTSQEEANLLEALDWFIAARDIAASLRFVVALQMYWFVRGRIREGCERSTQVLDLPWSNQVTCLRIDALNGLGMMLRDGDAVRAEAVCRESIDLASKLGDRKRKADGLANLGFLSLDRFDGAQAASLFLESLETHESLGNVQGIADSLSFLALTAFYDGHFERSVELNERSLRLWQSLDDHQGVVWAKSKLATVLVQARVYDRAFTEASAALDLAQAMGFRWGITWSLDGLGSLANSIGSVDLARQFCISAQIVRKECGLRTGPQERARIDHLHEELGLRASDLSGSHPTVEFATLVQTLGTRVSSFFERNG